MQTCLTNVQRGLLERARSYAEVMDDLYSIIDDLDERLRAAIELLDRSDIEHKLDDDDGT
jgi:hypothetical protein